MAEKIQSIRVKEGTLYRFNKLKLDHRFKSADQFINFILSLFENGTLKDNNKTIVKHTNQKI